MIQKMKIMIIIYHQKKKKKIISKPKDPNAPKRPSSAWLLYSGERRAKLQLENKKMTEISKIAGAEWKQLTEEQKKPYEIQAQQLKTQYQQDVKKYQESNEYKEYLKLIQQWKEKKKIKKKH